MLTVFYITQTLLDVILSTMDLRYLNNAHLCKAVFIIFHIRIILTGIIIYYTDICKQQSQQNNNEKALRETQTLHAAYAGGVRPPSLYRIWSEKLFSFQSY